MKLQELSKYELKQLEATIGQLLIDEPDMKLSELQERILGIIQPEHDDDEDGDE